MKDFKDGLKGKTREELVLLRANLVGECEDVKELIDEIDYDKRFAANKKWVGKYFRQIEMHHEDKYYRLFYVYDIDKKTCEIKTIEVHYWEDKDDHFSCEYNSTFDPKGDDLEKYIEIEREEWDEGHNTVLEKIDSILGCKT